MSVVWLSVLVICGFVLLVAVIHLMVAWWMMQKIVKAEMNAAIVEIRLAIKAEMNEAVSAMKKRMDATEIYLTAAEQHTAIIGDYEKHRQEEHDRRQKEYIEANRRIIREEIARQLKAATATVVGEVHKNPEITADRVIEKATDPASGLPSFRQPGTDDSHHGGH